MPTGNDERHADGRPRMPTEPTPHAGGRSDDGRPSPGGHPIPDSRQVPEKPPIPDRRPTAVGSPIADRRAIPDEHLTTNHVPDSAVPGQSRLPAPNAIHGRLGPDLPHAAGGAGKRTTLAQVAELAGVSVSTASLAFSGSGPVSAATRDRVHAAAETLHYAGPDPRGQSLRRGRSGIIGVVLEERVLDAFRDPIKIAFLDGIAQETTPGGRGLLLLPDASESSLAMESASMDGVVLIGCSPRIARSVEINTRRRIPVVALGGPPMDGVLTISLNDREATELAAQHLRDLGHRNVAIVALPLNDDGSRGPLTPERELACTVQVTGDRLRGARAVFPSSGGVVSTGSFVDEGMIAGHALLDDPENRPTAIIAQSDLLAAGVIKAAEELGLHVPAGPECRRLRRDRPGPDHPARPDHPRAACRRAGSGRRAGRSRPARRRPARPHSICQHLLPRRYHRVPAAGLIPRTTAVAGGFRSTRSVLDLPCKNQCVPDKHRSTTT